MAKMLIKKHKSKQTIKELAFTLKSLTKHIQCSPLSIIIAAYYAISRTLPRGNPAKHFYASLIVAVSLHECSYHVEADGKMYCLKHGTPCLLRRAWFGSSEGLFEGEEEMEEWEERILARATPVTLGQLEVFTEIKLVNGHMQVVPSSDLTCLMSCFQE